MNLLTRIERSPLTSYPTVAPKKRNLLHNGALWEFLININVPILLIPLFVMRLGWLNFNMARSLHYPSRHTLIAGEGINEACNCNNKTI